METGCPEKRVCGFVIGKFVDGHPSTRMFATDADSAPWDERVGPWWATAGYVVASSCRRSCWQIDRPISHSNNLAYPFLARWTGCLMADRAGDQTVKKQVVIAFDDDTAS